MENGLNKDSIPVLVIDDDKWIHRILSRHLNSWGFSVTSAYDPFEAVDEAIKSIHSLIFLDIFLPEISGQSLLKLFRKIEPTSETPIIIMSANLDKGILQNTYANGANGFISKPITPLVLAKKIQESLDNDLFNRILLQSPDLQQVLEENVN